MDSVKMSLLIVALVLIVGSHIGSALQCVVCNSHKLYDGDECEKNPANFEVNCTQRGLNDGLEYTMCRKYDQQVEGEHRIDRDCAVDGTGRCVLRTGTKGIKLEYCECTGDMCNTAATKFTTSTLLSMLIATIFAAVFSS